MRRAALGPPLRRRSRMLSLDEIVGMAVLRQGLMMLMMLVLLMRVGERRRAIASTRAAR